MADGSSIKTQSLGTGGFIAYQDEEHGLGFQIASELANGTRGAGGPAGDHGKQSSFSYRLTSPRRTTADTLASLISNDAELAVVPLQNDRAGYDKKTLATLIDFQDYEVVGEKMASDQYVLAVPSAMVEEQAESAFPSSYRAGSVGTLANGRAAQTAIRRRIGTIYASPDALDRCGAAVDGFRAQGIEISRLPEHSNPYRDVLNEAYALLDPERTIQTSFSEHHNSLKRTSEIKGKNYGKPLVGVLLPLDVVLLGDRNYHADAKDANLSADYVVVDQGLVGGRGIETHFLVIKRKQPKTGKPGKNGKSESPADKIAGDDGIVAGLMAKIGFNTSRHVRVLLKVDTRGQGVADTAELTDVMNRGGLRHTPIVLNDRPDTLPTVFEIAVHSDADRKNLHKVLTKASNPAKGWHAKVLGCYASDRVMPDAPVAAKTMPAAVWVFLAGGFAMAGAIATYMLMS